MMNSRKAFLLVAFCLTLLLASCTGSEKSTAQKTDNANQISGTIQSGLRVIPFDPFEKIQNFRIYRGDYVVLEVTGSKTVHLLIPELEVEKDYPVAEGEKTYFKVPASGVFEYTAGSVSGVIEAIEYTAATYQEVSAMEAVELIKNRTPLILDVRTAREYDRSHLANAQLIPVGVFQNSLDEIKADKEDPIFLYCRSGNRSTVASRILIDAGYKQVINLRHGINDWNRQKLPLKR
jgi:rhodanese-related sulfurtransferase